MVKERPDSLNTVSMAETGRILGISTERVRQLIAAGRLETHRVEGWARPRLLRSEVVRFRRKRERAK